MQKAEGHIGKVGIFDTAAGRVIGVIVEANENVTKLDHMRVLTFSPSKTDGGPVTCEFGTVVYITRTYSVVSAGVRGFVVGDEIAGDVLEAYQAVLDEQRT